MQFWMMVVQNLPAAARARGARKARADGANERDRRRCYWTASAARRANPPPTLRVGGGVDRARERQGRGARRRETARPQTPRAGRRARRQERGPATDCRSTARVPQVAPLGGGASATARAKRNKKRRERRQEQNTSTRGVRGWRRARGARTRTRTARASARTAACALHVRAHAAVREERRAERVGDESNDGVSRKDGASEPRRVTVARGGASR